LIDKYGKSPFDFKTSALGSKIKYGKVVKYSKIETDKWTI